MTTMTTTPAFDMTARALIDRDIEQIVNSGSGHDRHQAAVLVAHSIAVVIADDLLAGEDPTPGQMARYAYARSLSRPAYAQAMGAK